MDAGTLTFYKNGVSQGVAFSGLSGSFFFAVSRYNGDMKVNFGATPFEHQAPTGHKCLCTANLPDSTIVDGTTALSIITWDGVDGTAGTVSGLNLENDPGLIWAKTRNHNYHNTLWDLSLIHI